MHCTKISLVRHHCGELIQGPLLMSGKQVVVLVTLPMDVYHAKAAFSPRGNGTGVTVWPDGKAKARRAVELLSEAFSLNLRGRVVITKNAEFSEGRGFGSSSAEVLAALRVVNEA
ncbi:MAG: hypothetical protein NT154_06795, partial [Verrucomicrobia bacterium]|nr:hypothetical protein [Verrucomicrobiota bacterium]